MGSHSQLTGHGAMILLGTVLLCAGTTNAGAQIIPAPPGGPPGGGVGTMVLGSKIALAGSLVVGAFGLSVASVIARAACVSRHARRELTSQEAFEALGLPFWWTTTEDCRVRGKSRRD